MSHPWYCYVLITVTLFCQEYPNSSPTKLQKLRGLKLFCQTHFKTSKRAYAPPVSAKLHWLPMVQRTEYKLSSMCCDAVSKTARLICFTDTSHPVHCVPLLTPALFGFQNKTFHGQRTFSHLGPVTWNELCTLCCNKIPVQDSAQNCTIPLSPWTKPWDV